MYLATKSQLVYSLLVRTLGAQRPAHVVSSANCARCAAETHMALFGPFTPVDRANSGNAGSGLITIELTLPCMDPSTCIMDV